MPVADVYAQLRRLLQDLGRTDPTRQRLMNESFGALDLRMMGLRQGDGVGKSQGSRGAEGRGTTKGARTQGFEHDHRA